MPRGSNLNPYHIGDFDSDSAVNTFITTQGWYAFNQVAQPARMPIGGITYYNTTTNKLMMYADSGWVALTGGGGTSDNSNVGPVEAITSGNVPIPAADPTCFVHLVTTDGEGGLSRISLADETTDGVRHRFTIASVANSSDSLHVSMSMTSVYTGMRSDGPAKRFDHFEVVWEGSDWWVTNYSPNLLPYFDPA